MYGMKCFGWIPCNMCHPYFEKYDTYTTFIFEILLDSRAHMHLWNALNPNHHKYMNPLAYFASHQLWNIIVWQVFIDVSVV